MRTITAIIVIIISFSISVINLVIVNNSAIVFRIITLVQSLGIITIISSSISVIQLHHQQTHPMKITFFLSVSAFLTLFTTSITVIMAFFFFYRCHHRSTVLIFFIILPFFSFFSSTMPPSFTFFLSYRCNDYQHQRHYHCLYLEHSYLLHITAIMMLLPISFLHIHPFFFFTFYRHTPTVHLFSCL